MRFPLLLTAALLTGCVSNLPFQQSEESRELQLETQLEDAKAANLQAEKENLAAEKENLAVKRELTKHEIAVVSAQSDGADPLSEAVAQMAVQLNLGLQEQRIKRLPIAILHFVELGSKAPGSATGERLSENLVYQLQQHGYNLVDYRAVSLNTSAKDPLSTANLSAVRNRYRIHFVLTGTYSQHPDGIVVNARVLDTTTRQIMAAASTNVPYVRLEGALPGYDPIKAMDKGMIIENSSRRGAVAE